MKVATFSENGKNYCAGNTPIRSFQTSIVPYEFFVSTIYYQCRDICDLCRIPKAPFLLFLPVKIFALISEIWLIIAIMAYL